MTDKNDSSSRVHEGEFQGKGEYLGASQADMFEGTVLEAKKIATVSKRNELIRSPNRLSVHAQKVLGICLSKQDAYSGTFNDVVLSRAELAQLIGVSRQYIYKAIDDITSELTSTIFVLPYIHKDWEETVRAERLQAQRESRKPRHIPKPDPDDKASFNKIPLFAHAKYNDKARLITFRFNEALKDYVLGLKGNYSYYELHNILSLQKNYAITCYELMRSFLPYTAVKAGQKEVTVNFDYQELRRMLGVSDDSYKKPSDLKREILDRAAKEVCKTTDLNFDVELIRRGGTVKGKVVAVQFTITAKEHVSNVLILEGATDEVNLFLRQILSPQHFNTLLDKYKPERILRNIHYLMSRLKDGPEIKHKSRYLAAAVDNDYAGSEMVKYGKIPINEPLQASFVKDQLAKMWQSLDSTVQDDLLEKGYEHDLFKVLYPAYKNKLEKASKSKADRRKEVTDAIMDIHDTSWGD